MRQCIICEKVKCDIDEDICSVCSETMTDNKAGHKVQTLRPTACSPTSAFKADWGTMGFRR